MTPDILILLAAHDGAAYVREQIGSILRQDRTGWRLVVSDDGEGTAAVLQEYADRFPDRIVHHRSGLRFGCAARHFMHLLRMFHDADYVMFSDQDDVWHPDKITLTLDRLMKPAPPSMPALVATDLRVVDAGLRELHPSFARYARLDLSRTAFHQLLTQNMVTGCTVMINRALAELVAGRTPQDAPMAMHDWWLALAASAFGRLEVMDVPTVDYRQHGGNALGADNVASWKHVMRKIRTHAASRSLDMTTRQAKAFAECFKELLTEEQAQTLEAYGRLRDMTKIGRLATCAEYGFWKHGLPRRIGQVAFW